MIKRIIIRINFIILYTGLLLSLIALVTIGGLAISNTVDTSLMLATNNLMITSMLMMGIAFAINVVTGFFLGWEEWHERPEIVEWYISRSERSDTVPGEEVCPTQP